MTRIFEPGRQPGERQYLLMSPAEARQSANLHASTVHGRARRYCGRATVTCTSLRNFTGAPLNIAGLYRHWRAAAINSGSYTG